jgi:hypothetical protein
MLRRDYHYYYDKTLGKKVSMNWEQCQAVLKELYEEAIEDKKKYPDLSQVYYKFECWNCGRVFYARSNRARYCISNCAKRAYSKRQSARKKQEREKIRSNRVCEYSRGSVNLTTFPSQEHHKSYPICSHMQVQQE